MIALLLIAGAISSYCQYPISKVIGKDTVVIMTVKQANEINILFKSYGNTIDLLKDSLTIKNNKNDSLNKTIYTKRDTINYWQGKYEASRELYRAPKSRDYDKKEVLDFAQKIILIAIILVQFQSLK